MRYHPTIHPVNSDLSRGDTREVNMTMNPPPTPATGTPHSVALPASFFPTLPSFYRDYSNVEHLTSQVLSRALQSSPDF